MALPERPRVKLDLLASVPLLARLGPDQLAKLAAASVDREYAAGEVIAREGETDPDVFVLLSGAVEVHRAGRLVATLSSGRMFGEGALLVGQPRSADLLAKTGVRCLAIQRWDFWTAVGVDQNLAQALFDETAYRLRSNLDEPPTTPEDETVASPSISEPIHRRDPSRCPTGTSRLDDLLLGGIPAKGHVLLLGDAFVGKEVLVYAFLAEGLRRGEPAIVVTAARSAADLSPGLMAVLPQLREYEQVGMLRWVDVSKPQIPVSRGRPESNGSTDSGTILAALAEVLDQPPPGSRPPARVGFLGLSAVLVRCDERATYSFLHDFVSTLRSRAALAMYSLERGPLSEGQVETVMNWMDGAILFRQDRDKTWLSAKGFGDVQTREWVDCRATPQAMIIGSTSLEHVR